VSSPFVEPASLDDSSPKQLLRCYHRLRRSPDYYSPISFIATILSESTSYRDVILHPE
jgi:hypothetical protein